VRKFARRHRERLIVSAVVGTLGLVMVCTLAAHSLRNAGRIRELEHEVGQALAGAETAIEAGDLALAGRRVAEAKGRLEADRSTLHGLAAKADRVQQEIEGRQVDEARLRKFLKTATDAQEKMSYSGNLGGERLAEDALKMYGIETDRDWLSRLEHVHLTAEERQKARETAYVTLVSLADFRVRWEGWGDDAKSVQRSLELLEHARTFHEPTRAFYFVRSECYRRLGNQTAADEDLRQFKAAPARTAWDYYLPGHTAGWRGKLDEEIEAYKAALRLQPDHYNSLFFLAFRSLGRDNAAAAQVFRACLALRPDHVPALRNRAIAVAELGGYEEAIAQFREVIRIKPDDATAHDGLGNVFSSQGKLEEAIAEYREALRLQPDLAFAHYNLGNALRDQGKTDEAIAEFREALRLQPDDARFHNNLGNALRDQGKTDEAIAEYREALRLQPDDARFHNNLGIVLKRQGKTDEAIAEFREALRLQPDLAPAHGGLGNALRDQGKLDGAIAEYREALRLQPDDANSHNNLGIALKIQGKLEEAIGQYREAIRLKPDYESPHHNLANVLRDRGKLKEAVTEYREAVRLKPSCAGAHAGLAIALRSLGKLDEAVAQHHEAVALHREAIRRTPSDAEAHHDLAWLLATAVDPKWREPAQALELAMKAVQLAPENASYAVALGVAQYRAGHWEAAIEALEKTYKLQVGQWFNHNGFFLAMAHWQLGHKEEARRQYDKSVEWMEKYKPADEKLKRFRAEAAELLGIAEEPDQTHASGASDEKEKSPTEGSEEKPNAEVKQDENEK
jgi:tetratricopeptide (TPR) repeat protein